MVDAAGLLRVVSEGAGAGHEALPSIREYQGASVMKKIRIVSIGGTLGSGKTTLVEN